MVAEPDCLLDYHAHPGRTSAMLQGWEDRRARSSYEVLAERVDALPRTHHILDLACGDGFLLEMLHRRGFLHLEGVDQSEHELSAARERLDSTIRLHHADARATALPPASFDVVVCHMALMLITPVERVLAEIARIGRPGARVFAVLNRPLPDPVFEAFRRELHRTTRAAGLGRLTMGDPRTMQREGLLELLGGGAFDPGHLRIEDFELRIEALPPRLWSKLRLLYDVARLPAEAQEQLGHRAQASWASLGAAGEPLTCSMGMRLVEARTRGAARKASK